LNSKLRMSSSFSNCLVYLHYCLINNINYNSTVFKGTLYELYVKDILSKFFKCDLLRNGGAYDNGIDLLGNWDISAINLLPAKNDKKKARLPANCLLKSDTDLSRVNVWIQCKNLNKKIDAKVIRELAGIYDFHINSKQKMSNFIFLFSPHVLSKQGLIQMDKSNFPLIHWQLSPLKLTKRSAFETLIDETNLNLVNMHDRTLFTQDQLNSYYFDLSNWSCGNLNQIYMNPFARKALAGLDIEMQLDILRRGMNANLFQA